MIDDEPLEKDPIAGPDTRPQMWLFIPFELAIMLGILGFSLSNVTHDPKMFLAIVPLWVIAALLVRRDVNGVRVALNRLRLIAVALDAYRWGGLSASPWPLNRNREHHAV